MKFQFQILDGNEEFSEILRYANDKSEWIWQFFFKYVMVGYFISLTLETMISVIFHWIKEKSFNTEYLYHAYCVV